MDATFCIRVVEMATKRGFKGEAVSLQDHHRSRADEYRSGQVRSGQSCFFPCDVKGNSPNEHETWTWNRRENVYTKAAAALELQFTEIMAPSEPH